jgi:cellulose synthase operon protein C
VEEDGPRVVANQMSGDVHGAAVQVGSLQGDVHVHVRSEVAELNLPVKPPEGWSDLGEVPAEVRFLLRAQIQVAQGLPYQLRGARQPTLATVYVRQDLGIGAEDPAAEVPRPSPIVDSRGQLVDPPSVPVIRTSVRPPSRTVREALDSNDNVLVTGGPGQGKSTLSLRLAADVAARWTSLDGDEAPLAEPVVPLRLTARELASRLSHSFPEAVAESVGAEYGALLGSPLSPRLLRTRIAGCRWLLLIDGLDEVADSAERSRLVSVLAAWAADEDSPYRLVLTTRPVEGAALAPLQRIGTARYELQPFDEEALRQFAGNWFGDVDHGDRFVRQIRAAYLDELARVPLLATIAAIIFEQYVDRPLPDNQYELYESYLRYLRSAHPVTSGTFEHVRDDLLEHLGTVRLKVDTSLTAAANDWVSRHLTDLVDGWQEELVTFLAAVGPLTRRAGDLMFLHHSFAEHLAATAEARLLPERFDPERAGFVRLLHAARPKERGTHARAVLLHYTRLHQPQADSMLQWLHSGSADQHLLAARLLASHLPAGADTTNAFLTTVRAWAMTTRYPGQEILGQASRAAHHPGIAEWLAGLMRDEDAPWQSHVEAAAALATRLHAPESPEALARLRAAVDDTTAPVRHRLAAAEALSECGKSEQEAAERGLRSVLADPSATMWSHRNAAVVLASFGGGARDHAVAALAKVLDDSWNPDDDLVEAAGGLVEIDVELHERCAGVFRTVLGRRTTYLAGLRDAAVGLASLGPHQLTEAVAAVTKLIDDKRVEQRDRIRLAEVLAELGPQHRIAAGEHLMAIDMELRVSQGDRWFIAASLAQVGFPSEALVLVRRVLSDPESGTNARLWATKALADLGPDHREEALRTLLGMIDDPMVDGYERAAALGLLAASGEPHRTTAVAALRDLLADPGEAAGTRCHAANELCRLGPEHHGEVADHLLGIATSQADPEDRVTAWQALKSLGPRLDERASAALLALSSPAAVALWESHRRNLRPYLFAGDEPESVASVLTTTLRDTTRSGADRLNVARALLNMGRRFHRTALGGVTELIRSRTVPPFELRWLASGFNELGSLPRAELAEVLRSVARGPDPAATTVCQVAEALASLDHWADPEISTALRRIVEDGHVDPDDRCAAAILLVRAAAEDNTYLTSVVPEPQDRSLRLSEYQLLELADLGADLVPALRALRSNRDVTRDERLRAATTLVQLGPDPGDEVLTELRTQSADEYLDFQERSEVLLRLVRVDPRALNDTIAYHVAVLHDQRRPVGARAMAAYQLTQLDGTYRAVALTELRRFVRGPGFTAAERAEAVRRFARLCPRSAELSHLALSVARDPVATSPIPVDVHNRLPGRTRLEVEQARLADRAASPSTRVVWLSEWDHRPLAAAAEAALRDSLTAVETSPAERVEAAAALGRLSPRHVPEAVSLLRELSAGRCAITEARHQLADLSEADRRRMLTEAESVVTDEGRQWRQRRAAAELMFTLTSTPPERAAEYLRRLVRDDRVPDETRVNIRYRLGGSDGLDRLREIRDDELARPAIRLMASNLLRRFDVADRAAGARVLEAIAADRTCHPRLRSRAARGLTAFGERGRELGVASLRSITADATMPTSVRAEAAGVLGTARPDLRGEIAYLLRELDRTVEPRVRVLILRAVGLFEPAESAAALADMTIDRTLDPGVRLRAAVAMTQACRDHRERAAIVAREIANDRAVAAHIRTKAARALARWSDICRAEAQELLIELEYTPMTRSGDTPGSAATICGNEHN